MNITHIYKDYAPVMGGIENHIKQLAEWQAARGHTVTVLVTQLPGAPAGGEMLNGVRVIRAARQFNVQSAPIALSFPVDVGRATAGADIAHLHAPYPIGEACNLLFGRARKTVITWHSDIVRQKVLLRMYAPLLKQVLARADAIMPTSEKYARTSPWLSPVLAKCAPVTLGIDIARFAASEATRAQAAQLRARWISQSALAAPLVVLSVGRLRYYKGLDDLIRALPALPDVLVVIAGNGPMEAQWKALAFELGVAARVLFTGSPTDTELLLYYQAADVYALPANSRAEALGLAVIEAMASGLPAITTEVGSGTSWVNLDGQTGLVVPPSDPNALTAAIMRLRDPALRAGFAAAARERAAREFSHTVTFARVEDLYRKTLDATLPTV